MDKLSNYTRQDERNADVGEGLAFTNPPRPGDARELTNGSSRFPFASPTIFKWNQTFTSVIYKRPRYIHTYTRPFVMRFFFFSLNYSAESYIYICTHILSSFGGVWPWYPSSSRSRETKKTVTTYAKDPPLWIYLCVGLRIRTTTYTNV